MPLTSYDQSAALAFRQSAHRQRNLGAAPGFVIFETLNISRSTQHNANAFFNAFVHLNAISFSLIPPFDPGALTPGSTVSRYYMESDVVPFQVRDPVDANGISAPPFPHANHPKGTVIIDSAPNGTPGETPVLTQYPAALLAPSLISIGALGVQLAMPTFGFDPIWPVVPNVPKESTSFFLTSYSAQSWEFAWGGSVHAFFQCQKTRFKLITPIIGFMAMAQLVYDDPTFAGFPHVTDYENVVLESQSIYAAGVWHHIPFPTDFNVLNFRFVVLGETPSQWSARTGRAIS